MITILHTGDLHLRDQDIEDAYRALEAIKARAQEERPDVVVVAGDVFDSQSIKMDSDAARLAVGWFADMSKIAPVIAVSGTPSHEGQATKILSFVDNPRIWVGSQPEQVILRDGAFWPMNDQEDADAIFSLVPTPTKQFWTGQGSIGETDQEIAQAMNGIFAGFGARAAQFPSAPHVLVGHFSVRGAQIGNGQQMIGREIEIGRDQLALANADLVCLGHIHLGQKLGENIFYSGSIRPLNWGEMHEHGLWIHKIM